MLIPIIQSLKEYLKNPRKNNLILLTPLFLLSCASLENRDKTLLLEEIQKEESTPKGEMVDPNTLWEGAKIEKRWVPNQFRGNRIFVPGHYEYVVITPGHWKAQ